MKMARFILDLILPLVPAGHADRLASGCVITGGAALLQGMPELAEEVLGMPVRRGSPKGIGGLVDVVKSPEYSTAVGLVQYGAAHRALRDVKVREERGAPACPRRRWAMSSCECAKTPLMPS